MSNQIVLALIALIVPTLTVLLTHWRQSKATKEVHSLVNDRMSSALDKIANLEKRLGLPHSESDEKAAERKAKTAIDKPAIEELQHPHDRVT